MAVDGSATTFWASKYDDVTAPVRFVADLGEAVYARDLEIVWTFPPKTFTVRVSSDGNEFADVFSTESNVVLVSSVPLLVRTRYIEVVMSEACGCGVAWAWLCARGVCLCLASHTQRMGG